MTNKPQTYAEQLARKDIEALDDNDKKLKELLGKYGDMDKSAVSMDQKLRAEEITNFTKDMTKQIPPKLEEILEELHMKFDLIDFDFINVKELEAFIKKVYEAGGEAREKEIKSRLNPDLKQLVHIGKAISIWHETCEDIGLEVIWQQIGDEVMGERSRPIKAISKSPLFAFHEIINQHETK